MDFCLILSECSDSLRVEDFKSFSVQSEQPDCMAVSSSACAKAAVAPAVIVLLSGIVNRDWICL